MGNQYLAGHRHGETAQPVRKKRQAFVDGTPIMDGAHSMASCRVCGRRVRFTTDGNGHLVAKEITTWRTHPCENP